MHGTMVFMRQIWYLRILYGAVNQRLTSTNSAQFLDGLQCLWSECLGASLQWLGSHSSGPQRDIIVLSLMLLYPYHVLIFVLFPVLMFEYIYDVTTAINIFLTLTAMDLCFNETNNQSSVNKVTGLSLKQNRWQDVVAFPLYRKKRTSRIQQYEYIYITFTKIYCIQSRIRSKFSLEKKISLLPCHWGHIDVKKISEYLQ